MGVHRRDHESGVSLHRRSQDNVIGFVEKHPLIFTAILSGALSVGGWVTALAYQSSQISANHTEIVALQAENANNKVEMQSVKDAVAVIPDIQKDVKALLVSAGIGDEDYDISIRKKRQRRHGG
jgi:hypothetical protein